MKNTKRGLSRKRPLTSDEERAARDHWNEIDNILNPITEVTAEYGSCKWKEQIESLIYDEDERGDREELFINHLNGGAPPKEQKTHPADTDPQIAVDVCEWQVKRFENIATRNPERMGIVATAKALLATARAQLAAFEAGDPDWYKIGEEV